MISFSFFTVIGWSNVNVCQPLAVTVISLLINSVEASVIFVRKLPVKTSFPVELVKIEIDVTLSLSV